MCSLCPAWTLLFCLLPGSCPAELAPVYWYFFWYWWNQKWLLFSGCRATCQVKENTNSLNLQVVGLLRSPGNCWQCLMPRHKTSSCSAGSTGPFQLSYSQTHEASVCIQRFLFSRGRRAFALSGILKDPVWVPLDSSSDFKHVNWPSPFRVICKFDEILSTEQTLETGGGFGQTLPSVKWKLRPWELSFNSYIFAALLYITVQQQPLSSHTAWWISFRFSPY